ncbi:hypothetical protein B0O99DRAFT_638227 [Bisporella sp. PMI_857]|nr:hypothetical protein B0O99DRAFT_638227 [Bisporella sp. PMI_857]
MTGQNQPIGMAVSHYSTTSTASIPTKNEPLNVSRIKRLPSNSSERIPPSQCHKVIGIGESEDGTYLTVERINGIELGEIDKQYHQLPVYGYILDGHQKKNRGACQAVANENAATFIRETVLPQLAAQRPSMSGFNGFAIPPPWLAEYEQRAEWIPEVGDQPVIVFVILYQSQS